MNLSPFQKEVIGRATMVVAAVGLAVGATKLLVLISRASSSSADAAAAMEPVSGLLIFLILAMYVVALTLGCFVFCAWDKRKSNVGRVMTAGDFFEKFFTAILESKWW